MTGRGFGFVTFASFSSAEAALENSGSRAQLQPTLRTVTWRRSPPDAKSTPRGSTKSTSLEASVGHSHFQPPWGTPPLGSCLLLGRVLFDLFATPRTGCVLHDKTITCACDSLGDNVPLEFSCRQRFRATRRGSVSSPQALRCFAPRPLYRYMSASVETGFRIYGACCHGSFELSSFRLSST